MSYVNLNGKLIASEAASVSPGNRAFRYGYGLFETMLVIDNTIALWEYHAERLFAGLTQLYFDIPKLFTPISIHDEILATVRKNKLERLCRVRLQVFAGNGGMLDAASQKPEYIIECFELDPSVIELNQTGLVTGIAKGIYKSTDSLANLKTCSALPYVIAAKQAKDSKWNDALICNTSGNLIESTIANIFWIKDGIIHTPPLAEGCIAGVMRRHLLQQSPLAGYTVAEEALTQEALQAADAVFLTNAIRRIKWVRSIGETEYHINMIPAIYNQLFR